MDLHVNSLAVKEELDMIKPEAFCSPYELRKLWNRKRKLVGVGNLEIFEARSGDPTKNRFRIRANSLQYKSAKVRKCDVCDGGCAHELPLHIAVGNRKVKYDHEVLQLGHR